LKLQAIFQICYPDRLELEDRKYSFVILGVPPTGTDALIKQESLTDVR